jgi:membrane protein
MSWLIVLLGAEITFAFQHADTYEFEPECRTLSFGYKRLMSLWVMHYLVKCFENGKCPPGVDEVSMRLRMPARLVRQILSELTLCTMVAEVNVGGTNGIRYQPSRDISTITIAAVIEALERHGGSGLPVNENSVLKLIEDRLDQFRTLVAESPENSLLVRL